jgi:hypothetical protein
MGWTKRQIVVQAFEELALAGYEFDLSPEELQSGLRRLDALMATWVAKGIRLGYAQGLGQADSDLDDDSCVPMLATEAVYMALAVRTAGSKGKSLSPGTLKTAKDAFDAMSSALAREEVQQQQWPSGLPRGAGNKPWRTFNRPFMSRPDTSPIQGDEDGGLTITE